VFGGGDSTSTKKLRENLKTQWVRERGACATLSSQSGGCDGGGGGGGGVKIAKSLDQRPARTTRRQGPKTKNLKRTLKKTSHWWAGKMVI